MKRKGFALMLAACLVLLTSVPASAFLGEQRLGAGSYSTLPPDGAKNAQTDIYRTERMTGPMPTNRWWSSLAWKAYSEAQYPHPLAVKNEANGLSIYAPGPRIQAHASCVCGTMSDTPDFSVGHTGASPFTAASADGYSDWFINARYEAGSGSMNASYGLGSPYVYFMFHGGNPRISFPASPDIWSGDERDPVLGITAHGAHYGLFGPSGSTWDGIGTSTLTNHLNGKSYFAIAALPDNRPETLQQFRRYAYAHVTDTKVSWSYHADQSEVETIYTWTTSVKEGTEQGTIFAMYPHQWKHTDAALLPFEYDSVRGVMKTGAGNSLRTVMKFTGVLPSLPFKLSADERAVLQGYVNEAQAEAYSGPAGTHQAGKRLGKLAALAQIAEQAGDAAAARQFRSGMKEMLQDWLKASDDTGRLKRSKLFYYNDRWGALIGYPAENGSGTELNDHHAQYGYFIRAAAEIARIDSDWASDGQWGKMVKLLIQDIANADRSDTRFPFLRGFDPYAGHSWQSGHGQFADGNYSGSPSEAMNAWLGLILWGEAAGDTRIRDLGIYMYTTEMNAINEYWFDAYETKQRQDFSRASASMVWGGKTAGSGWSNRLEQLYGTSWLPITAASLYLAHHPDYADRNYAALLAENGSTSFNLWADLVYMYRAASDPEEAASLFDAHAETMTPEAGNSKANAYYWIHSLKALGHAVPAVTADSPLYAVFNKDGSRTYAVYNMTNRPKTVTFSDGTKVKAEPLGFGIAFVGHGDRGNEKVRPEPDDGKFHILPVPPHME
ncbi:glycosyl hydrolase [Paenibacillus apiarius]|uniref:glucan endo-1,3-beta-D-glucosidase n=1 Tax=Paenibacillus apiarius TaxID=46240 RepID=A0ABT4DMW7_9BACL|nr:glycosyl hydrolase [Paenibacillus apiarius]MCY9514595.1 glycosyl hydrolase [Paenibacillus apiarius]MCY9518585.1 glycosyl hydrolase [Paenibacillus apiarius]MCY9552673.1 glycosyl hydrolase [Paenibacillus apiarius]MCY9556999.1 glycosyl hydrolase [Paenibacillus apiarius]MCY9686048.1 glycosyl hydrolase [Paenibacillus apiarius]